MFVVETTMSSVCNIIIISCLIDSTEISIILFVVLLVQFNFRFPQQQKSDLKLKKCP